MDLTGWRSIALATAGLLALSFLVVETPESTRASATGAGVVVTDEDGLPLDAIPNDQVVVDDPGKDTAAGGGDVGADVTAGRALACEAGRNGGETDIGVTATSIKLAATNVRSGPGSSFLGESHSGLEAVVARVNAGGGICGRLLDLRLVDDGWDANRGRQFIENFIRDGVFALPVVPSSEGLTAAISAGVIKRAGIPVVGSDGMLKEQYQDPWVWPVATATVSTMRVMAEHAYDKGARTFGIVYDNFYKFGIEGAAAFRQYVGSLPGAELKAFAGIPPLRPSYGPEANAFNEDCEKGTGKPCDFVAFLLEPGTAEAWIASQPSGTGGKKKGFGGMITGGAQPLFNERFARNCGDPCSGMLVWTGYNPPVGPLANLPDIAEYRRDVQAVDPGADITNQFLQGAYLGMRVFVEALERVGPNLTRARLRQVMNSMRYKSQLSSPLAWTAEQRFANLGAQAFEIVTASGSFAGFRNANTGFLRDPEPGAVPTS